MTNYKTHREMCLQSEVTSRSAACDVMRKEIDFLEEGLREAKKKISELQRELEFRRTAGNRSLTD